MKKRTDYLIIGNSAAGLAAAESIRKNDKKGQINVCSSESHFNYSKPLITYYLAGKLGIEKLYSKDRNFYTENNISLNLNSEIVDVSTEEKTATTVDGVEIKFNKLLVASGGKPIIPDIRIKVEKSADSESINKEIINERNTKEADKARRSRTDFSIGAAENLKKSLPGLNGVFTFTTLDEAAALKKYIEDNKINSASILGGGLIGLKTAEALLELKIKVNIIELEDRILSASFDSTASEMITRKIEDSGSRIFTGSTIDEIYVRAGKITSFSLRSGKRIPCGLLVVAVGVSPNTEMLKNAGIRLENGILVDKEMKTSNDNIYAAGDAVKSCDILTGKEKNIAIWPLAVKQGSVAGSNMSGGKASYNGGFFMNSVEILDIPVISIGLSNLEEGTTDGIKIYRDYNPDRNQYRKVIVRDDRIIGAILAGSIERAGIYSGLVSNQIDISGIEKNIVREDFGIIQLPADYRKHLIVGEIIEV